MKRRVVFAAAAMLCLAAGAAQPVLQGQVTQVIDGNHVVLQSAGGAPLRVTLAGIDAPDLCQSWGPDARAALMQWLDGHDVTVKGARALRHGEVAGTLMVDGSNINARMVEEGHAWSQRGRSGHGPYLKEERVAHALARGLFAAGGALMPREYRAQHGPCAAPEPALAKTPN
jgi:endonuclease YncB( thermonuclease family)